MNGVNLLIMLIAGIFIASTGVVLYTQLITEAQTSVKPEQEQATININNVLVSDINDNQARTIIISVTSEGAVKLEDTLIILRTNEDSTALKHREGTLERNQTTGYYTE